MQTGGDGRVAHGQVDLVVVLEGSVVHVGRSEHGPHAVHDEHFRVHHRAAILVDADAGLEQRAPHAPAGVADPPLVGRGPRQDDRDLDAPRGELDERAPHGAVRQEVGRAESDVPVGAFHQEVKRDARSGGAIGRRALDDERRCLAHVVEIREVLGPGQHLSAALQPVLGGDALQRGDDRPLDSHHRIAPGSRALPAERPPVGNPGAAGKRDPPVDDQQLTVGAVVEPREREPPQPLIGLDAAPGLSQPPHGTATQAEAADRVDDDRDVDAVPRTIRERGDELVGDLPGLEDVELHVDRVRRAPDGLDHRRIELGAVSEDRRAVAVVQRRPDTSTGSCRGIRGHAPTSCGSGGS